MPPRKDSLNRNETFGRLLSGAINSIATYEGKTAPVVEEELGALAIVAGKTIQRYKAGHLPPEARTIEILAEAAIRRGFLGREWLARFLHAAHYPFANKLLDRLCPIGPARPRPPHVYHNLPAPTYSQFVMRAAAFADVQDGLSKQSAITLIVGLGGNGKTSLAREAAAQCLRDGAPSFDAVVWVSDKDRPGTTNLSVVLDEIARTLDYPGFTQFEHDEKRREVENLLRRQRVLIVVDNFETITDGALLAWLQNLSEPSKALITAREYRREFRRGGWLVELRGMTDAEARELVIERLRMLRIEKLVNDQAQLEPLLAATGGNPKAIEITLGLMKYERRPFQQVVDDLYAARGELFEDLFTRAWSLLDEAARRILLAMTFFPSSASNIALSTCADVQGFAFDRAIDQLIDLALVDVEQADLASTSRYTLHPLVRAFAGMQIIGQPDLENRIRNLWIEYFLEFARQCETIGWDSIEQFDQVEQDIINFEAVMRYCYDKQYWKYLIEMVLIMRSFWGTRGYYETRDVFVALALYAAEQTEELTAQISLLCTQTRSFCYRNNATKALECEKASNHMQTLVNPDISLITRLNYAQIRLLILLEDFDKLFTVAQRNVAISELHGLRNLVIAKYDIAVYFYHAKRYDEAEELLNQIVTESIKLGYARMPIFGWLSLANIALHKNQISIAEKYLQLAEKRASELKHQRYVAEVHRVWARLHTLQGNLPAARASLAEAIDLFERLGMRRELAEARDELAQLDELATTQA